MRNYDDIINLPYVKSTKKEHMSINDRAAQFGAFRALDGYEEKVNETGRYVDRESELTEDAVDILNEKLMILQSVIDKKPIITVEYFKPDLKKEGGFYVKYKGNLKKIKEYDNSLVFEDGEKIFINHIRNIESNIFEGY